MPCQVLYSVVFCSLMLFSNCVAYISFIKNDFIHIFSPTHNSNCISLFLFSIIVNLFNLSLVPRFFLQSFPYFSQFLVRYVISHNLKLASYLLNFGTLRFARYQMLIVFTISWFHLRSSPKSAQCTQHEANSYPNQLLFPLPATPALQPLPPPPAHPVPFRLYCHFQRHASTFVDP